MKWLQWKEKSPTPTIYRTQSLKFKIIYYAPKENSISGDISVGRASEGCVFDPRFSHPLFSFNLSFCTGLTEFLIQTIDPFSMGKSSLFLKPTISFITTKSLQLQACFEFHFQLQQWRTRSWTRANGTYGAANTSEKSQPSVFSTIPLTSLPSLISFPVKRLSP